MKTTLINPTKTTHVAKVVALDEEHAVEISQMLGWTAQQYYDHQYEQYEAYLKRSMHSVSLEAYNEVRYSELMRGFWVNEWMQRNLRFLLVAEDLLYEGLAVDPDGNLIALVQDEAVLAHLHDEYMYVHNAMLLSTNPHLRQRFEHVLRLIES